MNLAEPTTIHMFDAILRQKSSGLKMPPMPNVFVDFWNECDALLVQKSGYTHEIEMKLSVSDFKADFNKTNLWAKEPLKLTPDRFTRTYRAKHDLLSIGDCFPNRFTFLVPENLISKEDVPPYAGLMYFKRSKGEYGRIWEVKKPKLLHKNKISTISLLKLATKFVYRYNKLLPIPMETFDELQGTSSEEHF